MSPSVSGEQNAFITFVFDYDSSKFVQDGNTPVSVLKKSETQATATPRPLPPRLMILKNNMLSPSWIFFG